MTVFVLNTCTDQDAVTPPPRVWPVLNMTLFVLIACRGQDAVLPLPETSQAPLPAGQSYQVKVLPDMVTLAVSTGLAVKLVLFFVC